MKNKKEIQEGIAHQTVTKKNIFTVHRKSIFDVLQIPWIFKKNVIAHYCAMVYI